MRSVCRVQRPTPNVRYVHALFAHAKSTRKGTNSRYAPYTYTSNIEEHTYTNTSTSENMLSLVFDRIVSGQNSSYEIRFQMGLFLTFSSLFSIFICIPLQNLACRATHTIYLISGMSNCQVFFCF